MLNYQRVQWLEHVGATPTARFPGGILSVPCSSLDTVPSPSWPKNVLKCVEKSMCQHQNLSQVRLTIIISLWILSKWLQISIRLRANALINHWCGVFFWVMAQTWSACWDPRISHIFSVFNQMGFNLFWANPAWLLPSGNQTLQWKVLYTGGFRRSIQML